MDQPSSNPDHPSNELHDAAYPVSDYQPGNLGRSGNLIQPVAQQPDNSVRPGNLDLGQPSSSSSTQQPDSSKYPEVAAPSLAFTSGQASSSSWHQSGPSHLDNAIDPPPSYEQSQSHSQPRSATSSQQPSPSAPSIAPVPPSNHVLPLPPPSEPGSPGATPLRPIPTYNPLHPPVPQPSPSGDGVPTFGPMPAISYQKPEHQTRLARLRRKSCYMTLLLVGVFLLALFVGLMIGFRDKLDDDGDEAEETRRPGNNQLYKGAGGFPPSETVTQTVIYTMIR